MFDQLKQLAQLKKIKDSLEKTKFESEKQGVKVVVTGKMEIEEIILNPELDYNTQGKIIKDCVNEAFLKVQKEVASKMFSA